MKKLLIILLVLFFAISSDLNAQPYQGGEITWECLSNGKFKFTMKLYRECYTTSGNQPIQYPAMITLASNSPAGSINLYRVSITDISPVCNANANFPHIFCHVGSSGMPNGALNMGAQQQQIFTSDSSYPSGIIINGVPPSAGWNFYWSSACRLPSTNISTQPGWTIRAKMYPYNNQNTYPCFDSSPAFAEKPITAFPTGNPMKYNHNAIDTDLDSLAFSWAQALSNPSTPITTYNTGYSYSNPFGGSTTTLNSKTGEISIYPTSQGAFLNVLKVQSYKCGILMSEIFRETQIVFTPTGTNNPPNVTPPFQNAWGQYTLFNDTVVAGECACFNISGTDFEFLPNGTPQTMSLEASGSQFGDVISSTTPPSMSDSSGCLNPPCATLTPAPCPTIPLTGQFGLQTSFNWQTDCSHLNTNIGCGASNNVYNFTFKIFDDYCPIPAMNLITITVVVVPPPDLLPPIFVSVITDSVSGNNILNWNPPIDSMNLFYTYYIYSSTNCNGSFTLLDSVSNLNTNSYTDIGANGNSYPTYYYIKTIFDCNGNKQSSPSSIIAPSFADVGVSKIISPSTSAVGNNVTITIKNFGSDTLTACDVSYDFGASLAITESWTGVLYPCDSIDYTFTSAFNPPTTNYILCSNTLLPNDKNSSNDQICQNIISSLNSFDVENYFQLSQNIPNPTNKTTSINYFLPKPGNAVFNIVNIVGEVVYSKEYESQSGENKIELDISNFESGIYYYSLEFEGIFKVKKMVVLH